MSHPVGHSELAPDLENHPPQGPGKQFSHQGPFCLGGTLCPLSLARWGSGAQRRRCLCCEAQEGGEQTGGAGARPGAQPHQPALPLTCFPQSFTQLREETGPSGDKRTSRRKSGQRSPGETQKAGDALGLYSTHSKNQTGSQKTQGTGRRWTRVDGLGAGCPWSGSEQS